MIIFWIVVLIILCWWIGGAAYCEISDMVRWLKCKRGIVIQNTSASLYGVYKGCIVGLCPIMDENNPKRVVKWVPDPNYVDLIEKRMGTARQVVEQACSEYPAVSPPSGQFVTVHKHNYVLSRWDYNAVGLGKYKGETVRLVPVVSMDNQREILFWVHDPFDVKILEKKQMAARKIDTSAQASEGAQARQKIDRIIIDGSNVVFADKGNLIVGLKTCLVAFDANKMSSFVFLDANIFHKLEELENGAAHVAMLKELIDKSNGTIVLVPAGARADDFILKKADTDGCHVLSNDRYKPYVERYPWIEQERVHRFAFVDGRLMIPDLDIDVSVQS